MGYIAPVTHYQYNQYAERDIKKDYDPFHFVPVQKINPALNGQLMSQNEKNPPFKKFSKKDMTSNQKKNKVNNQVVEHAYSELTGKGKYFSECI